MNLAETRAGGIHLVAIEQLYIIQIEFAASIRPEFLGIECDDRLLIESVSSRQPSIESQSSFDRLLDHKPTRIIEDWLDRGLTSIVASPLTASGTSCRCTRLIGVVLASVIGTLDVPPFTAQRGMVASKEREFGIK